MALARCEFCESGLALNDCSCAWALRAQRHGLIAARREYRAARAGESKLEDGALRAVVAEKVEVVSPGDLRQLSEEEFRPWYSAAQAEYQRRRRERKHREKK